MRRRIGRCCARDNPPKSWPSNATEPRLGANSPTISRATVDLPLPDSPTRLKVRPRAISKLTPSTARRIWCGRRSMTRLSHGRDTSKPRARSRTWTSGGARSATGGLRGLMQPAGGARAADREQLGTFAPAALEHARAARVEGAARRDLGQARHRALDLGQPRAGLADPRDRAHQ